MYLLTFINDFSPNVWIRFMKAKGDVFEALKEWKILVENQMNRKSSIFAQIMAWSFHSEEFSAICKVQGIARHKTARQPSHPTRVVERMNRTLIKKFCCMVLQSKMAKYFGLKKFILPLILSIDLQHQQLTLRLKMRYVQVSPLTIHTYEYLAVQLINMFKKESLNQGIKKSYS